MNRIANISSKDLLKKLINSPYSFAVWQMPQSSEKQLIVALTDVAQSTTPLSDLAPGFLLNRFSDNHSSHPFYIPADLTFQNEEVKIAAHIGGNQIDEFVKTMEQLPVKSVRNQESKSTSSYDGFEMMIEKAIAEIKTGQLEKIVLARYEDIDLPENFSVTDFFDRICEAYPNAFCSFAKLPGQGLWLGATPELLLADNNERFKTVALAGTKSLMPNQTLSEIAWTQKEIEEQAFVSRYIVNCFKKIRLREFQEKGPKTVQAGHLAHLKTEYLVNYSEVNFDQLGEQMLDLLHPTSAVCGMPLEESKAFIAKHEAFDRSFYAGFLGPVNFNNATDLFVNLRCARIQQGVARLYAGAGITEDSHPEHERKETTLKMSILKRLI